MVVAPEHDKVGTADFPKYVLPILLNHRCHPVQFVALILFKHCKRVHVKSVYYQKADSLSGEPVGSE